MRAYRGVTRADGRRAVFVEPDGAPRALLGCSLVVGEATGSFDWGRGLTAGCMLLAATILSDLTDGEVLHSPEIIQASARHLFGRLPRACWSLSEDQIMLFWNDWAGGLYDQVEGGEA